MKIYKLAQSVPKLSPQEIKDSGMFGPVWHGTTSDSREKIQEEGFKIFVGPERSGEIAHGYEKSNYHDGIPAPVHHLGYGIYFTTSKSIAKQYSGGTVRGLKDYYLNTTNIETINFGSTRTMMKWWIENGYDPELALRDRVAATVQLTNVLRSKFDAVWFKGKGMFRLLDGDQVCVYNTSVIVEVDKSLSEPGQVGSKLRRRFDGVRGVITDTITSDEIIALNNPNHYLMKHVNDGVKKFYQVKWQRGGQDLNFVPETEVELIV